jgi:hypothetical protein
MNKLISLFIFLSIICTASAQSVNNYVFSDFQNGAVYFKNHKIIGGVLNYESISKKMVFKQNAKILELSTPEEIDSVIISGRTFVSYFKGEFFEKIAIEKGYLYLQYNSKKFVSAKEVGFGGYSELSNTKSISVNSLDGGQTMSNDLSQLTSAEQFRTNTSIFYWIKKGNDFFNVSSKNQILKAFPNKKQKIQDFLLQNTIKFDSVDDVKKLLNMCFSN